MVRAAANVAAHAESVLSEVGDDGGAKRARAARDSLRAPRVRLIVTGEYQQGKSSLINALLGARATPTEPLSTTTAPIRLAWGRDTRWAARLAPLEASGKPELRAIDGEQMERLATTSSPSLDDRAVTGIEATMDHPLLRTGLTLVDTPCVSGGLSTQTAGLVLGLLSEADALVFVTDASQELTAPELEFIRMARTLCPALLVVMTKIDLYPDWQRILDINQGHLASVDPDAVVLPASPQLRAASVRWGDPEMERASGVPLVAWYITTTLLARARQGAVSRCGTALARSLASAARDVEERLEALDKTTGRHRTAEKYNEAVRRLETLRTEAPKRVRLELRAFTRSSGQDLTNRFAGVNEMLADMIKGVDPADQWSEIEATLHRSTNKALAEHIAYVHTRAEAVVTELRAAFGLEESRLSVELSETEQAPGLTPDLDAPELSSSRASKAHDIMRGAASTGFMGMGVATMIVTGGVGALALGAGAAVSTVVLSLRRDRTRELEARRSKALQACRTWVNDARAALADYADEVYKELELQLESQIERGLKTLLTETEAQRARLDTLRKVAAEKVPEEVKRVQGQLDRVRLVHAHARRLSHHLARPELQEVSR